MALETTRLPGENAADILTQANTRMRDMIASRCQIGTQNDKDNGLPVSIALSSPVGQCTTASGTANKVVTISNFADFELQSGIEISVYFANPNTANNPTLNVGGTGAIPITVQGLASNVTVGSGCFKTGLYNFKYIDITVSGTRIQQWLLLNGGIAEQTNEYTKYGDGTIVQFNLILNTQKVYLNLYEEIIEHWDDISDGIHHIQVNSTTGAITGFIVFKNANYGKILELSYFDSDTGVRAFKLYNGTWTEEKYSLIS